MSSRQQAGEDELGNLARTHVDGLHLCDDASRESGGVFQRGVGDGSVHRLAFIGCARGLRMGRERSEALLGRVRTDLLRSGRELQSSPLVWEKLAEDPLPGLYHVV